MLTPEAIPADAVVSHAEAVITAEIDGHVVLMSDDAGHYYQLDDVGSAIWAAMAEPVTVASVCDTMMTSWSVAPETCRTDVLGYLAELADEGLITIAVRGGA